MPPTPKPVAERIRERITIDGSGCWLWQGSLDRDGYGSFKMRVAGRSVMRRAHRVSFALAMGPISDGLTIDHLCRVRHCVNPDHPEAVTSSVNSHRGDTLQARNAAKTTCDSGHALDEVNTYVTPDGRRQCRPCRAEASRAYRRRFAGAGV